MATSSDHEAIRRAALDYFEGWFDGDAVRMDRALHPELVKRRPADELGAVTKEQMIEATREGQGKRDADRELEIEIEIEIVDVYGEIASVTVHSAPYHEYLHLVRTGDGWKIANTLYVRR